MIFGYEEIKRHGKRALISHLIPIATFIFMVIIYMIIYFLSAQVDGIGVPNSAVRGSSMILLALITIGVAVWNIKEGVKQLNRIGGGRAYES